MKVVVLAGGPPKKLRYILKSTTSRALLAFPRGTLLEKHLSKLQKYFDEVYVVSDDERVRAKCEDIDYCRFVRQESSGIEGAICDAISAMRAREEIVTIDYGDVYFGEGYIESHMSLLFKSYEPILTVTRPFVAREQYLGLDVDIYAQTVAAVGRGDYIFAGLASLPSDKLYTRICSEGGSLQDLLREFSAKGMLRANIWLGEWVDIDTPWDYMLAIRLDLSKLQGIHISQSAEVKDTAVIEPPVYISDRSFVDHYAVIKGPVYVGRNVLIGAHSFVRNQTAIFDDATIGAYSEVKRSVIYVRAYVSSHCYVADSVVGEEARLAPYTVTLNIPYSRVSSEVLVTTSQPLEKLKIGSIIATGYKTKPHDVLEPATIYGG